jgi:hypothetical protein
VINLIFLNNRCNYKHETNDTEIYEDYADGDGTVFNTGFDDIATEQETALFLSLRSHYEMLDRTYKTNPKKHLLRILRDSGFIITDDRDTKTQPAMTTKQKKALNETTMANSITEYDILQTPEYKRVNEILKLPDEEAIKNIELYTSQSKLTQHFNMCKFTTSDSDTIRANIDERQTFKILKIRCSDNNIRGLKDIINRCGCVNTLTEFKDMDADDYKFINDIRKSIKTRGKDRGDITTQEQARAYISSVYLALFGSDSLYEVGELRTRKQKDKKQTINKVIKLYDYDTKFIKNTATLAEFRKAPAVKNKSLFV